MSDSSTNLSLPFLMPSQAQKHVTHNEALRLLDSLVQLAVVSATLSVPPGSPDEGDRYIVAAGATLDWAGQDGRLAVFDGGGWAFLTPRAGWRAWVAADGGVVVHDGSAWRPMLDSLPSLGIGMDAPPGTPFAARLNDALMTAAHVGDGGTGDMVLRMNRETAADDLGLVLQTGYSTRALIGLFGSAALRLAVSADGSSFVDALVIGADGAVAQPNLARFRAHTDFDNYADVDTWTTIGINTADYNDQGAFDAGTGRFTAPAAGTYLLGATLLYKQNLTNGALMRGRLLLNAATAIPGSFGEITGPHLTEATALFLQTLVPLAQGDTVELQGTFRAEDGYFAATETSFWGARIG